MVTLHGTGAGCIGLPINIQYLYTGGTFPHFVGVLYTLPDPPNYHVTQTNRCVDVAFEIWADSVNVPSLHLNGARTVLRTTPTC